MAPDRAREIRAWTEANERARAAYHDSGKGNVCGTYAGYRRHQAAGEATCEDCRRANRENTAKWAAARQARMTSDLSPTSGGSR